MRKELPMKAETKKKIKVYAIAIAIPLLVGLLSALLTRESMNIDETVNTPPLSPPSILFPIVWSILYVLMGISSAMVYLRRENDPDSASRGLAFYGASLFVNFLWSIIFFNMQKFLFAFVWLLLLLYLIVKTVFFYKKVYPTAAYLQIPYILWVSFAGYLNLAIYLLNR